ncbi:MAG: acyl-CoA dehydratase activase [Desulfovermiculus sp.]
MNIKEQTIELYAGVDVGASRTKAALINSEGELTGSGVLKSGIDFQATADRCLELALAQAGGNMDSVRTCVSTGYGRKNVAPARFTKTEIACHAKGCFRLFPMAMTIIDIGGQDNKVIKLDPSGRRIDFKMNRKCAAGTGAFLEEMAQRLDIALEDMDSLARKSRHMVELGSFCTVFSATEVLENIRQGRKLEDIVKGVYHSMLKRVLEMDSLQDTVVMTGGVVAHNPYLAEMASEMTGNKILVPSFPQLTGAFGAALFGLEAEHKPISR